MSVVAVILCARCAAEHRPEPGRLGETVALNGRLLWHGFDAPSARALRNFDGTGPPPAARHSWVILHDASDPSREVPAELAVWCRRHGAARVAADAVTQARGSMPLASR